MSAVPPARATPGLLASLANRRVLAILLLGFSSGLPIALVAGTLQAWLKDYGFTIKAIAIFTWVQLPYTLKFLWAPALDRFTLPLLGRRRGWILLFQTLLAAAFLLYAVIDPAQNVITIGIVAIALAALSASQDIVIDAYRADVLPPAERGLGAAAVVTGYRLAMITSGALALIASDQIGWHATFIALAAIMLACTLFTWFAPEPQNPPNPPRTLLSAVIEPLREFVRRPGFIALLALIVFYKLGDALALSLATPFLKSIGFSNTDIGAISKGFGLVATIVGSFAGGLIVARIGLFRALLWLGVAQAITILPFAVLALAGKDYTGLIVAIGVQYFGDGMGSAAFVAFLTALCSARFSAFQYALFSSIASIGRVIVGPLAGAWAQSLGWWNFYVGCLFVCIPGMIMVWWLRERLTALDAPAR